MMKTLLLTALGLVVFGASHAQETLQSVTDRGNIASKPGQGVTQNIVLSAGTQGMPSQANAAGITLRTVGGGGGHHDASTIFQKFLDNEVVTQIFSGNLASSYPIHLTGGKVVVPNGNVGIGTSNPRFHLELQAGNPVVALTSTNSTNPWSAIRGNEGTWIMGWGGQVGEEDISIGSQGADGRRTVTFAAGGEAKMKILANGNVGIGTVEPTEKLSVYGKIRAQEIKVEVADWPDYVFAEGYKVRTLEDLEKFIKLNKHLPEMPSDTEVEAGGIELGEMNKRLLKKIEELTLYIIDQGKEIANLKEQMRGIQQKR